MFKAKSLENSTIGIFPCIQFFSQIEYLKSCLLYSGNYYGVLVKALVANRVYVPRPPLINCGTLDKLNFVSLNLFVCIMGITKAIW